jgi:aspartate/methionine/tyrosine aminotransferase
MADPSEQARALNELILNEAPAVHALLSERGLRAYFPKEGILAQTAEAKHTKLNATIGIAVEDDGTPMHLQAIAQHIKLPPKETFPYAPSYGKQQLREVWVNQLRAKNPSLPANISLPIVTNGVTHALSILGYLFVNPGDSIILPDKFWPNYRLMYEIGFNAKLVTFNTFAGNGLDLSSFERALSGEQKKQIVLLNFPNNPSGYTPTKDEARELVRIVKESAERGNYILAICDDAYFGLFYEQNVHQESLFASLACLHDNVLAAKADGATKEDYVWGFRVGFLTYGCKAARANTYRALEDKSAGAIRGTLSNVSHLSQSLLLKAFEANSYKQDKKQRYSTLKARYRQVKHVLKNKKYHTYFSPLPYNSGYFMCIELKHNLSGEAVRKLLLKEYSTGVIAIGNLLRIAFSSIPANSIERVFENIYEACKRLKEG